MGFSSVLLVGHDDGGLLALMAAKKVKSSLSSFNVSMPSWFSMNRHLTIIGAKLQNENGKDVEAW